MTISILIPIYKSEKYVEQCLRSVFEQTYNDIEYIIVNDATPDRSMEIVNCILNEYPERKLATKIINNEQNQGIALTRNILVKHATGDYIYFVDSDDFIEKNTISEFVSIAQSQHPDIIRCSYFEYKMGENIAIPNLQFDNKEELFRRCLSDKNRMNTMWLMLIRRNLLHESEISFAKGINGCEDFLMTIKLLYYADTVINLPLPLYHYRIDNLNSITHDDHMFRDDSCTALIAIVAFLKEKGIYQHYLEDMLVSMFLSKQQYLINKEIRDISKYINTFPEANSVYKRFPYSRKTYFLFYLAEHRKERLLKLLCKFT